MASGTVRHPAALSDISSNITLSSSQGTIQGFTAYKYGAIVTLTFLFTTSASMAANTEITISVAHASNKTKPVMRTQLGGSNSPAIGRFLVAQSGDALYCYPSATIAASTPFWLTFTYLCNDFS